MKKGFTLIEILLGLSMSVIIFIIATNLVVSLLFTTTKGRRLEDIATARNDVESDINSSVRWSSNITFIGGELQSDDNKYKVTDGRLYKNGVPLTPANLSVENFDVVKRSSISTVTTPGQGFGLTGAYYKDQILKELVTTRSDYELDFNWGSGSPATGMPVDRFSARWTGQIEAPESGLYRFYTISDDGVRLWIDSKLIIDNWTNHSQTENVGEINLVAGKLYDIRLEYFEFNFSAVIRLFWSSSRIPKQIVPSKYLHETAGSTSVEISFDLVHRETDAIRDNVRIFISPRAGVTQTFDSPSLPPSPTPRPSTSPTISPTASPGSGTATPKPLR